MTDDDLPAAYDAEDPLSGDDWAELVDVPPDEDDPYTAVEPDERGEVDAEEFWRARPVLSHLHTYARAQRVSPWAVLGATLARVVAATPPAFQIPPTIGGNASLNLFVGLVGNSGDGKDAAQKVAHAALVIEHEAFKTYPLGSGEGLAHMFMRPARRGEDEPQQINTAALVTIGEIDTFDALIRRQASTVSTQLRQAAMGEQLGFFYVDVTRRMIVPEHAYRLCLVVGIQPTRSAVLLDAAEGGTPQRFLWLPASDPGAPDDPPSTPEPMLWIPPHVGSSQSSRRAGAREVVLPEAATALIVSSLLARRRGEGEALDGHALLTRTKVAAALAILDGRYAVASDDWVLSGAVMQVSDGQRARCQHALRDAANRANIGKALAEADRAVVIAETVEQRRQERVGRALTRYLAACGPAGETPGRLKNRLTSADREAFDDGIQSLIVTGRVSFNNGRFHLC